jgi:Xaa-Pro aminopeptidase
MTIKRQEFAKRRQELMVLMEPDSIAIIPSAPHLIRNRDAEYAFRQDSDFYYLTGFDEPEAVLYYCPGASMVNMCCFAKSVIRLKSCGPVI